jgi:uncharacterized protein Yka (UPF0111/DUF47 family)
MTTLEDIHDVLQQHGFNSAINDAEDEPYHLAVTFPAERIDEEIVLRINHLEHSADLLDIWQMIAVFPSEAASDTTWAMVQGMLHSINSTLPLGKVLPAPEQQMLYYRYTHLTPTGDDSALRSMPPMLEMIIDFISTMAPDIHDMLENDDAPDDVEIAELQSALNEVQSSLMELMAEMEELEALEDDYDDDDDDGGDGRR